MPPLSIELINIIIIFIIMSFVFLKLSLLLLYYTYLTELRIYGHIFICCIYLFIYRVIYIYTQSCTYIIRHYHLQVLTFREGEPK